MCDWGYLSMVLVANMARFVVEHLKFECGRPTFARVTVNQKEACFTYMFSNRLHFF